MVAAKFRASDLWSRGWRVTSHLKRCRPPHLPAPRGANSPSGTLFTSGTDEAGEMAPQFDFQVVDDSTIYADPTPCDDLFEDFL
jgi:hypothetical protein